MKNNRSPESAANWMSPLVLVATSLVCLVLAGFLASAPAVSAQDSLYRTPRPLIVSRPINGSSADMADSSQKPEIAHEESPTPDQPADAGKSEIEAPAFPDNNGKPDTKPVFVGSETGPVQTNGVATNIVDDVNGSVNNSVLPETNPPSDSGSSSSLVGTRAVLWGIVASMATLVVLGSLIFKDKDEDKS